MTSSENKKSIADLKIAVAELQKELVASTWWMFDHVTDFHEEIWTAIKDEKWSVEEELQNKLDWLLSRKSFRSKINKNDEFKNIEYRLYREHFCEDVQRYMVTNDFALRTPAWDLFDRWINRYNHPNSDIVSIVKERLSIMTREKTMEIWAQWVAKASEFGIELDIEKIYGSRFVEMLDLNDKMMMLLFSGGKREARKRNKLWEERNQWLMGFSLLLEIIMKDVDSEEFNLIRGSILWTMQSTRTARSRDLFFSVFKSFNTGCPDYKTDITGFHQWEADHLSLYESWKHESSDTLRRCLWNYRYPDDEMVVLFEPNHLRDLPFGKKHNL